MLLLLLYIGEISRVVEHLISDAVHIQRLVAIVSSKVTSAVARISLL